VGERSSESVEKTPRKKRESQVRRRSSASNRDYLTEDVPMRHTIKIKRAGRREKEENFNREKGGNTYSQKKVAKGGEK